MSLLEMLQKRHSIRKYTDANISDQDLQTILQAGLLSASGRAARPWEFIVVRNKETLQKMSESRVGAAKMLANANAAIVVIADESKTDVWVEDCSIAMSNMHLAASTLGIGSCWIQGRLRTATSADSGTASITTEDYVRDLLGYPADYRLEATLSLGMPAEEKAQTELSALSADKIHYEKY